MKALFRLTAWILAIGLVVFPVAAILNGWIGSERWPMRHLLVSGEFKLVSDQQVRATVMPSVSHGYFAVDLERVREHLMTLPWVKQADVRKRWPDRLEVIVTEYKPLARWGDNKLLSEHGEIFAIPKNTKFQLPEFIGQDTNAEAMMSFYSYVRPLFSTLGLQVERIRFSARGSWNIGLSNGLEIEVGRGDPQQRLARFARLMPQIEANDRRQLLRADLRYTNGFALTWKQASDSGLVNNTQQVNI